MKTYLGIKPKNALLDTMELALLVDRELESYKLEDLAGHWKIEEQGREHSRT